MQKSDLQPAEYNEYFSRYISLVSDNTDLKKGYENDKKMVIDFFSAIPKDKLEYLYQPDKWTIKELLQHIIDTERIFMYRCLRVARGDKTPLAGFEQNDYIIPSRANSKTLVSLLEEYIITRQYSIVLLKSFTDEDLRRIGIASGNEMSARAAAFSTIGHEIWHMNIIKERYL